MGQRRADRSAGDAIALPAERLIAHSRVMRALADHIRRFARAEANVLIAGETGTGKTAVARARRPFITIDCASLSPSLIDSELFGHERGAFTDAVAARLGRFELAGTGTVYLDGVVELSVEGQGKLLRIVEEKRVERLGGQSPIVVGARVVASTGADIEDAVRSGAFRLDLYHRLRVLPLMIPPLREHLEDVAPLGTYFLKRAAAAAGRAAPAFEAEAALADRPTLEDVERRYIAATLRHARGNQTDAARILGISRKALWEKRRRYGLGLTTDDFDW